MHCFAGDSIGEFVDELGDLDRAVSVLYDIAENDLKYNAEMSKNTASAQTINSKQMLPESIR